MFFEHSLIDILILGVVLSIVGAAVDRVLRLDWFERRRLERAVRAAKAFPPKRPPELTVGTYVVVFSDGATMEQRFTPAEIDRWVTDYNVDVSATKPYKISEVRSENGVAVWPRNLCA